MITFSDMIVEDGDRENTSYISREKFNPDYKKNVFCTIQDQKRTH